MKKLKINKRILTASLSATTVAIIVIPVAVVFSNQSSDNIIYEEKNEELSLLQGSELPSPKTILGYKQPRLDNQKTNYSNKVKANEKNVYVAYYYDLDGPKSDLKPFHLNIKVIILAPKPYIEETEELTIEYSSDLPTPSTKAGYKIPRLDSALSNYTKQTLPNEKNIKVAYFYDLDDAKSTLNPIHLIKNITITPKNENETISKEVVFGSELSLPESKMHYKLPVLVQEKTNYTKTTDAGSIGIKAVYFYETDGSDAKLMSLFLTINLTITKSRIDPSNITPQMLKSTHEIPFKFALENSVIKPPKFDNFLDWSNPVYTKEDGTSIDLATAQELPIDAKFIASYEASPDDNHDGDKIVFKQTYVIKTKATTNALENTIVNKDLVYESQLPANINAPSAYLGYSNWSGPIFKLNDVNKTEITKIDNLNAGDKFLAVYSANLLSSYDGFSKIFYSIVYTIKQAKSDSSPSGVFNANYIHDSETMPSINAKTIKVKGYKDWQPVVYKELNGVKTYSTIVELNQLNINDKFTATYTALADSNYDAKDSAIYTVTYTVVKAKPASDPSGNENKDFVRKTAEKLPEDKKTAVKGWLDWQVKFASDNDSKTYQTLDELKNLPYNSTFQATYTALPNPKYETTKSAIYVVNYTVKKLPALKVEDVIFEDNFLFKTPEFPTSHAPTDIIPGFGSWSAPQYFSQGDFKINSIKELGWQSVGSTIKAIYTANSNEDYEESQARVIVKYKVENGIASAYNSITELKIWPNNSDSLPLYEGDAIVKGYLEWKLEIWNLDHTKQYFTVEELNALPPQSKFKLTYTAEIDPDYNATKPAVYTAEYTVKKYAYVPQIGDLNLEIIKGYLPKLESLNKQDGFLEWGPEKFYSLDGKIEYQRKDIANFEKGFKFKRIFTALNDPDYTTTEPITAITFYTIA